MDLNILQSLADRVKDTPAQRCRIMTVGREQGRAVVDSGVDRRLQGHVEFLHGPGSPVSLAPVAFVDAAATLMHRRDTILCAAGGVFGIPDSQGERLAGTSGDGAALRRVDNVMEALALASREPERDVVYSALATEDAAPAIALAVHQARELELRNFSALLALPLLPSVVRRALEAGPSRADALLFPARLCSTMGTESLRRLAAELEIPVVLAGEGPKAVIQGLHRCIDELEKGAKELVVAPSAAVADRPTPGRWSVRQVFQIVTGQWRGVGNVPESALALRQEYRDFDAAARFGLELQGAEPATDNCPMAAIVCGHLTPEMCPGFGAACDPEHPHGAAMAEELGTCRIFFERAGPRDDARAPCS